MPSEDPCRDDERYRERGENEQDVRDQRVDPVEESRFLHTGVWVVIESHRAVTVTRSSRGSRSVCLTVRPGDVT